MVVGMGEDKWLWVGEVKLWWGGTDTLVVGKVGRVSRVVGWLGLTGWVGLCVCGDGWCRLIVCGVE